MSDPTEASGRILIAPMETNRPKSLRPRARYPRSPCVGSDTAAKAPNPESLDAASCTANLTSKNGSTRSSSPTLSRA